MRALEAWERVDEGLGAAPPDDGTSKGGFWTWLGSELTSGLTSVKDGLTNVSADNWAKVKAANAEQLALAKARTESNIDGIRRIQESKLSRIVGHVSDNPGKTALYVAGGAALLGLLVLALRRK